MQDERTEVTHLGHFTEAIRVSFTSQFHKSVSEVGFRSRFHYHMMCILDLIGFQVGDIRQLECLMECDLP